MSLPRLILAFTIEGVFGFYAGLNILAFFMILFFLPETKQRTLEELDYVFGVSTRQHASHVLRKSIPWWFKKWVLWRRGEPEPQLYHFEDTAVVNAYSKGGPEKVSINQQEAGVH